MKEININQNNQGQRIDKFVLKLLPSMSKSFCYKMFRKKNITLNDTRIHGSEILTLDDCIKIYFSQETYTKFSQVSLQEDLSLSIPLPEIIYEDEALIVVNKEAGIFSQMDQKGIAVTQQLEQYYRQQGVTLEEGMRIGVSNRLDRNTTGITISGKTMPAVQGVNEAIKKHEVRKIYSTIVLGHVKQEMFLEGYLIKKKNRNKVTVFSQIPTEGDASEYGEIKTIVKPVRSNGEFTQVHVEILTGKTHQIRAHLSFVGYPIIGDGKYGDKVTNDVLKRRYGLKYQLLHAYSYEFDSTNPLLDDYREPFIAPYSELYRAIARDMFDE